MKTTVFKNLYTDFLSLIFPEVCYNCQRSLVHQERIICLSCLSQLPKTNDHLYLANELYQKFAYEPKVIFASSFLSYRRKGIAQKLIHQFKYKGRQEIGRFLGKIYGNELAEIGVFADVIVPIPIHAQKMRLRGFNQSHIFAEGLSEVLDIQVNSSDVIRKIMTKSQTRKSKLERWKNVDSIYEIRNKTFFEGKRVLIVDDVITTGATVGMLVDELVKSKVEAIGILAIASGQ